MIVPVILLTLAFLLGVYARPSLRKAWRKWNGARESEIDRIDSEAKLAAAVRDAHAKGKAEALAILVETDENSAIITALGSGVLTQVGVQQVTTPQDADRIFRENAGRSAFIGLYHYMAAYTSSGMYYDREWQWNDGRLKRAGLTATDATPQGAYRQFKAMIPRAVAICAQLDAVEAAQKEAKEEAKL